MFPEMFMEQFFHCDLQIKTVDYIVKDKDTQFALLLFIKFLYIFQYYALSSQVKFWMGPLMSPFNSTHLRLNETVYINHAAAKITLTIGDSTPQIIIGLCRDKIIAYIDYHGHTRWNPKYEQELHHSRVPNLHPENHKLISAITANLCTYVMNTMIDLLRIQIDKSIALVHQLTIKYQYRHRIKKRRQAWVLSVDMNYNQWIMHQCLQNLYQNQKLSSYLKCEKVYVTSCRFPTPNIRLRFQ